MSPRILKAGVGEVDRSRGCLREAHLAWIASCIPIVVSLRRAPVLEARANHGVQRREGVGVVGVAAAVEVGEKPGAVGEIGDVEERVRVALVRPDHVTDGCGRRPAREIGAGAIAKVARRVAPEEIDRARDDDRPQPIRRGRAGGQLGLGAPGGAIGRGRPGHDLGCPADGLDVEETERGGAARVDADHVGMGDGASDDDVARLPERIERGPGVELLVQVVGAISEEEQRASGVESDRRRVPWVVAELGVLVAYVAGLPEVAVRPGREGCLLREAGGVRDGRYRIGDEIASRGHLGGGRWRGRRSRRDHARRSRRSRVRRLGRLYNASAHRAQHDCRARHQQRESRGLPHFATSVVPIPWGRSRSTPCGAPWGKRDPLGRTPRQVRLDHPIRAGEDGETGKMAYAKVPGHRYPRDGCTGRVAGR